MRIKAIKIGLCIGVSMLSLTPLSASANPEDPTVTAGSATFDYNGNNLDIYQSTDKAIIDWRTFNIGAGEHTQFHQPSSNSFTLNRVTSNDVSQIDGMLSANGNIAIINPNGVFFGGGAQIDVGGLIATTSDIDNNDFMAGDLNFNQAGVVGAEIINEGHITVHDAGLVALVAPNVTNRGVIQARLGKVHLASADSFTLDMAGDGLINLSVNEDQVRQIVNEGYISADGGTIHMTAAQARETVDSLVVNKGTLSANSVGTKNGKIVLFAAGSNNQDGLTGNSVVLNEGTITATGNDMGETGGTVHMLADHVGAMDHSSIDASGYSGGGEILVGGDYLGEGDVPNAKMTYVSASATHTADGTHEGDGGKIIHWSDLVTRFYGHTSSKGGSISGNGGFIEVSSADHLDFQGTVSTEAVNGEQGEFLLDPTDITISDDADSAVTSSSAFEPNVDDGPSNLNIDTLLNALASSNVTVQTRSTGSQEGNIIVNTAISWSANRRLTLDAHNKIIVNADITARNRITFNARDVDLNANIYEHSSGASVYFQQRSGDITMGLAGGNGEFNLSTEELNRIQPGINRVYFGRSGGTALVEVGAHTWNVPVLIRSRSGELRITGAQDFGNFDAILQTNNLSINDTLTGTRSLTIQTDSNATIGLAGASGTLNISNEELDLISDDFSELRFGRTSDSQDINIGARTWDTSVQFRTRTGGININGEQQMGAHGLSFQSRVAPTMNANVYGTGSLSFNSEGNQSIGVNGGAGQLQITSSLLDSFIGFETVRIGSTGLTGAINVNAGTWDQSLELLTNTGVITIGGDQNFGGNDFTLRSNTSPTINGDLIGTGTITFGPSANNMSLGLAGASGNIQLSVADLDRIIDGWDLIQFGTVGNDRNITANAYTWRDNVHFQNDSREIIINGDQNFGSNNFTLTSDSNPQINAALIGTGILTFQGEAQNTSIGIGQSGTVNINTTELDRIGSDWQEIIFGRENQTGEIRIGARDWSSDLHLRGATQNVRFDGVQNMGDHDLTITSGNVDIRSGSSLNGTGILTIQQGTDDRTMSVGGSGGSLRLDSAELDRISDGWDHIYFGNESSTVQTRIHGYTWDDNVTFRSGSGEIWVSGVQDFGSNDAAFITDNLRIESMIRGTGDLTFANSDITKSIGLAGEAGDLSLTSTELSFIDDGWNSLTFGRSDGTGAINIGAKTDWDDVVTFVKDANDTNEAIHVLGNQDTTGAGSLTFAGNTVLSANISSSNNVAYTFGSSVTLTDDVTLSSGSAGINFSGPVDGGFNLTLDTIGDVVFAGNVGSNARLGDIDILNAANITAQGDFLANNFDITNVGGAIDFQGSTTLADITLSDISSFTAQGVFNADSLTLSNVSGTANFQDTVTITNAADFTTVANLTAQSTFGAGSLSVSGVSGTANFQDTVTITNAADFTTVANLTAQGAFGAGSLSVSGVSGTANFQDTVTITNAADFTTVANLTAQGAFGAGSLSVSGVSGTADFQDTLTITGNAEFDDVTTIITGGAFDVTNLTMSDVSGGVTFGGSIAAQDVDFTNVVNVTAQGALNADSLTVSGGGGAIDLQGDTTITNTVDISAVNTIRTGGLFNANDLVLSLVSGLVDFGGDVTIVNDATIDNVANLTSAGLFAANNLIITNMSGTADFAGAGADITNTIDISAGDIRGTYEGVTGLLDSNSGTVIATVTFDTLDLKGEGATLTPGRVGDAGDPDQDMANRITIDGQLMPSPNDNYTFGDFTIGFVPMDELPIPPDQQDDVEQIVSSIQQPQVDIPQPSVYDIGADVSTSSDSGGAVPFSNIGDYSSDWNQLITDYLYVDPRLDLDLNYESL